jgi:hypothetical protein
VGSAEYSSDTLEDQDDVDVSDDVMGKGIATKRTKSHMEKYISYGEPDGFEETVAMLPNKWSSCSLMIYVLKTNVMICFRGNWK